MSSLIQVRNVPPHVHRALKARAAALGKSLSDLVLEAAVRSLERPTREEYMATLHSRPKTAPIPNIVDMIREDRDR